MLMHINADAVAMITTMIMIMMLLLNTVIPRHTTMQYGTSKSDIDATLQNIHHIIELMAMLIPITQSCCSQ
jgi:type II secretory pathway component PulF